MFLSMVEAPGFEPGSKMHPISGRSQVYLIYFQTRKVSRNTNILIENQDPPITRNHF